MKTKIIKSIILSSILALNSGCFDASGTQDLDSIASATTTATTTATTKTVKFSLDSALSKSISKSTSRSVSKDASDKGLKLIVIRTDKLPTSENYFDLYAQGEVQTFSITDPSNVELDIVVEEDAQYVMLLVDDTSVNRSEHIKGLISISGDNSNNLSQLALGLIDDTLNLGTVSDSDKGEVTTSATIAETSNSFKELSKDEMLKEAMLDDITKRNIKKK